MSPQPPVKRNRRPRAVRAAGAAFAATALTALAALACRVEPIDLPAPTSWRSYQHPTLGVAFDLPDFLTVRENDGGALFRIHGANAVLLRFVDEEEAKRRGLWVGTPAAGPVTLGGRPGQHYVYRHGDGPVWSVTEAYVVPYRGKQLALEFRTREDSGVRQRMLASFRFLDPAPPARLAGGGG